MVRIYKKDGKYVAESSRYSSSGNEPVWKKIQNKKGHVKKGHGYVIATDKNLSDLKKKLRKKKYSI
jgi:hypothetical protein